MNISYQYLDGSTPTKKRKSIVESFQSGEGDVFLISLKAGGTGLNLTAADYVIHMDPWWNPAVEDQATDRAHRIGQLRPVNVYRFITKGTIEEKIVDLHQSKRDLADSLLSESNIATKLSTDDLIKLLQENWSFDLIKRHIFQRNLLEKPEQSNQFVNKLWRQTQYQKESAHIRDCGQDRTGCQSWIQFQPPHDQRQSAANWNRYDRIHEHCHPDNNPQPGITFPQNRRKRDQ